MVQKSEHPPDKSLWQYLDENIQSTDLIEHISRCPRCKQRLDEYKRTLDTITHAPQPELSAMLRARTIRSFLGSRSTTPSFMRFCMVRIPLYQVAGIVAAAVLIMHIVGSKTETDNTRHTSALSFHQTLQESLLGP
jgi:hypothetical protein